MTTTATSQASVLKPCHWSHRVNSTAGYCDVHGARWINGNARCSAARVRPVAEPAPEFDTEAALIALQAKWDAERASLWAERTEIMDNLNGHRIDRRNQLAVAGELERRASMAKAMANDLYELLAKVRGLR